MPDFDLVDELRKLRYGDDYDMKTFSSPEDKALAVASGAGANLPEIVGNAGMDIVNAYAPRPPEDRVTGTTAGRSLGEQTSEAARKNPGAAVTGNLAVTAPLRTAATMASGGTSVPAQALLQGLLGGAEGAYAAQEGQRAEGAGHGAALGAALPLAGAAAGELLPAISKMSPPKASGGSPGGRAASPAARQSAPRAPAKAAAERARRETMLPPSSPEAEAAAETKIPKNTLPVEGNPKYKPNYGPSQEELDAPGGSKIPWADEDVTYSDTLDKMAQREARGLPSAAQDPMRLMADERAARDRALGLGRGDSLHSALADLEAPNAGANLPTQVQELSTKVNRTPRGKNYIPEGARTMPPPSAEDIARAERPTLVDARPAFRARRAEARRPSQRLPGDVEMLTGRGGAPLSQKPPADELAAAREIDDAFAALESPDSMPPTPQLADDAEGSLAPGFFDDMPAPSKKPSRASKKSGK